MKKLFRNVKVNEEGINKSMEQTMDEVTSQIIEEHFAAVEEMEKIHEEQLSQEYLAEAEAIIEEVNQMFKEAGEKAAWHKGFRAGMVTGSGLALTGLAIGLTYISKTIK